MGVRTVEEPERRRMTEPKGLTEKVHGRGRVMADPGRAGGTREPGGTGRTMVPGGAKGARTQGGAHWSIGQGGVMGKLSKQILTPRGS